MALPLLLLFRGKEEMIEGQRDKKRGRAYLYRAKQKTQNNQNTYPALANPVSAFCVGMILVFQKCEFFVEFLR
ncbi:hypothetical protein AAFJ72_04755 [Brevibacillus gelatini]|uniref:hypothetical protein n=1 Tax=Brevibacillus gelatini TaxID=1655277 RepID=UPI003D81BF6A